MFRSLIKVNNDGTVDLNDIKEIVKDFGKTNNFVNQNNDLNSDGKVSFMDIVIVAKKIIN
jgi:Ca2+-binding EF-hand superfamily protein